MAKLYVVGTPIGNLGDLSPRATRVLGEVDFIAAEDTRVSVKLLNHIGVKKPMISYFEHNKAAKGQMIVDRILAGENCAIITDAGMPCISDPGEDLVKLCAEFGVETEVVPGPSAVISALAVSGLATGRFSFEGFLSVNKTSRRIHLDEVKADTRTLIFYEAPHKLLTTLKDMGNVFGQDRKVSIVKELTKIHETVFRTTFGEAVEFYTENTPKGEFVLVIEGATKVAPETLTLEQAVEIAAQKIEDGMAISQAAKEVAKLTDFKKGEIYTKILETMEN